VQFHEVEVTTYPLFDHPPYTLALASRMAEVAELAGLDLLHCHYAIPHSVSAFLAKSMLLPRRLPVVTTLHGTDITLVGADRSYLPITRFSIDRSDGVTAVSEYLRDETYRTFSAAAEIEVIYNFVNPEHYRPGGGSHLREQFAPAGEKVLIHLSNFRAVKRPSDCVEIFARVAPQLASVLVMVGDGPERSRSEFLARSYGIDKRVLFLGKQDNIEDLIGSADLMLLPSDNESFGLVALEAMACEVPVVASRVGGLPELVTNGKDGYLVTARDVDEMAARALEVLSDDRRRAEMGARARETALGRFSSTRIIPQYEAFYRKVLEASA